MTGRCRHISDARGSIRLAGALVLIAIILLLGLLLALPLLLSQASVTSLILDHIEQRTNYRLSTDATRISLFPRPSVELTNVLVRHAASHEPFFAAERLELALQVLPLFQGRVLGRYVVVDRPRLTIRRELSGRWSIGTDQPEDDAESRSPLALLETAHNVLITGGLITVADDMGKLFRKPIQFELTKAAVAEQVPGRSARLEITGEIPQDKGRAAVQFDGTLLQGLHGDGVGPEEAFPLLMVEGDLRATRLDPRHVLSAWTPFEPVSDGLAGDVQVTAHVRFVPRSGGYDLTADEWRLQFWEIALQGTAAATGLGTHHPRVTATLSATPVTLSRLLSQAPSAWVNAEKRGALAKWSVDGLLTLQSLTLAGPMESGPAWTLSGSLAVNNGRFLMEPESPVVENLSATLLYDTKQLRILDLRALWGPVRIGGKELLITHWLEEPRYDLRLEGRASLAGLLEQAGRVSLPSEVQRALEQIRDVRGEIQMAAHVMGAIGSGTDQPLLDLEITAQDAGLNSPLLPMPLDRMRAKVKATGTLLTVEQMDGYLGPIALAIRGTLTKTQAAAYADLRIKASGLTEDLVSLLGIRDEERIGTASGTAALEAIVVGRLDRPRVKGTLELNAAGFTLAGVTKAPNVPAAVRFDAQVSDGGLVIRRADLLFPPIRLAGEGVIDWDMAFRATVRSRPLRVRKLPPGLALGPLKSGLVRATLRAAGRLGNRRSYTVSGEIAVDDGQVAVEGLETPLRDVFVTLQFDRDRIRISRLTFHAGTSDVRVSGVVEHWMDSPHLRLLVESSQIDAEMFERLVRGPSAAPPGTSRASGWRPEGTLDANVFVDYVYYRKFLVTGLSFHVGWSRGALTVDHISGDTNDGHVGGRIVLQEDGENGTPVRSAFRISGIPAERLLSLASERSMIHGWLTATGRLQGRLGGTAFLKQTWTSRRPVQITIEDGKIFHVPVITKLLSVMNLPALLQGQINLAEKGLPFDRLKLVFSVERGMIGIKQFLLDSPVLKISGTGRYDLVGDEFDMTVAASPLGSYTALLKRVPLFGTLLAGERQGFDTAIFSVSGKAEDPEIRYLPAESLATGIKGTAQLAFDILVNAITLPKEAFALTEEALGEGDDEGPGAKARSSFE